MLNWNINPESLLCIPGKIWIYWKNRDGIYLGCNDFMAESLDFSDRHEIKDRSDQDLPVVSDEIEYYRACDKGVISSGKSIQSNDTATLLHSKLDFHTIKSPIYDNNSNVVGVVGFSYLLNKPRSIKIDNIRLNTESMEILSYLIKGKTAKEIAKRLNLSHRTIEHNLDNIKKKLNVCSKSQLIDKVFDHLCFF